MNLGSIARRKSLSIAPIADNPRSPAHRRHADRRALLEHDGDFAFCMQLFERVVNPRQRALRRLDRAQRIAPELLQQFAALTPRFLSASHLPDVVQRGTQSLQRPDRGDVLKLARCIQSVLRA